MYWTFCLERGAPQRVNHASVAVEDKIYSFGGYCGELDMPIYIDTFVFNTNTWKWRRIQYEETRQCPPGCYGHTVVAYGHLIYLWGGQNVHGATNILYCFNTKTLSWTRPETSGLVPNPTDGHSACVIGDCMYIFGGFEEENDSYSQKLYSLNLITFRWQKIETSGTVPCKRDFHTASVIGSCIYIYGGRSIANNEYEFYPGEITYLDTNNMHWTTPAYEGELPTGRRSHSAFVHHGEIFIIGGYNGNWELHMNDVCKYDPVDSVWTELTVFGKKPHPRRRHCSVLVGDTVYLFGGSSLPPHICRRRICAVNCPDTIILRGGNSPEAGYPRRSRPVLREHSDMHILEFVPSLKTLSQLKIMALHIKTNGLPASLRSEIKLLKSLKQKAVFTYQKKDQTAERD